jgi:two-component system, LytTR family, response regulator
MEVMRVLIVDDEAPARTRLRQMIASQEGFEVAGEATTGIEAMRLASELKPDLMLLDIQMPGCSDIDVAACLARPRPQIIFCTAHEQHAVDAFELHAIDYLLKPISRVRLAEALGRVRALAEMSRSNRDRSDDDALNRAVHRQSADPARFLVKSASNYLVVGESRVLYFSSEDGLTKLIADSGQYWMDPTLNELEQRLDRSRFFRISRAALINLNAVEQVFPLPGGGGEVLLKNRSRLEVARRRFRDLLQSLGGGHAEI